MTYHKPVMLQECIEALDIRPDGIYVDVTFGGGGHSRAILEKLGPQGKLFGFDQDPDAKANVPQDQRFVLIAANFRHLKQFLSFYKAVPVDGILADLGISSHQIDVPERGFSTRFDGDLDMRMDQKGSLKASDVLNNYEESHLVKVFSEYGEIFNSKKLARTIVHERKSSPIKTGSDFKKIIKSCLPPGRENQYLAQVYQSLRIEVNQELEVLKEFLIQSAEVLKSRGRLVVMSYHSLEDRLVKNYMQKSRFEGVPEKDVFGNDLGLILRPVARKPVIAGEQEVKENPRARSAKLRIAEKI